MSGLMLLYPLFKYIYIVRTTASTNTFEDIARQQLRVRRKKKSLELKAVLLLKWKWSKREREKAHERENHHLNKSYTYRMVDIKRSFFALYHCYLCFFHFVCLCIGRIKNGNDYQIQINEQMYEKKR